MDNNLFENLNFDKYSQFEFNNLKNTDINIVQCGTEDCAPLHSFGPAVRDHFLIHYIVKGKGIFQVNNKTYHLEKNQGFLICPQIVTYYEADKVEPWTYYWIGFHGIQAMKYLKQANLTRENPLFTYDKDNYIKNIFLEMIETCHINNRNKNIKLLGLIHLFLSQLIESIKDTSNVKVNPKEEYIKSALEYIQLNYQYKLSVTDLSKHIGLNRSYLYTIFKEYLNISPQEFIIQFKINKAYDLITNTALPIAIIARSVGYEDPFIFSKAFKKVMNMSPTCCRNKISK